MKSDGESGIIVPIVTHEPRGSRLWAGCSQIVAFFSMDSRCLPRVPAAPGEFAMTRLAMPKFANNRLVSSNTPLFAATAVAIALVPATALPRAFHAEDVGDVTVRCSSVNSTSLPETSLERYDIDSDGSVGLFSCVVQRMSDDGTFEHLSAEITAQDHSIGQTPQDIPLREVLDDDLVTYLGTYAVAEEFPLTFRVSIDSEATGRVEFTFDDMKPQV
jgi:hypothetical protein